MDKPSQKPTTQEFGAAGERYAAAILSHALCAQASHTSLLEDGKKLDIKISLKNSFSPHESILSVHGQIKHGSSFADSDAGKIKIKNVSSSTIKTLQDGTQPALFIWVSPWPKTKLHWHIILPKGKHRGPIVINENTYVTPSLRFDLSRFANFERRNPRYPCLSINPLAAAPDLRTDAKKHYSALQKMELSNPLLGNINVTRLAWRHITRRSRTTAKRRRSFHVVKYLKNFLSNVPTRYLKDRKPIQQIGDIAIERSEIIFWYNQAFKIGDSAQTLLIRFIEEISYPISWIERPLTEVDVTYKVTLMSWWYKPEKESGASLVHTDARKIAAASHHEPSVTLPMGRGLIEAPQTRKQPPLNNQAEIAPV